MTNPKAQKNRKKKKSEGSLSGDRISVSNVSGNAAVAAGRGASANSMQLISQQFATDMATWRSQMEDKIDNQPTLSPDDKEDLKQQVVKIEAEATKGAQVEISRLEKLINTLNVMGPDIWDVAIASISNPLAGIGLVVKKIGDKIRLERQSQAAQSS
jgi:hypothetical protein